MSSSSVAPSSSGSSSYAVAGWIVGSIGSSVSLILLNKVIMANYNFTFIFSLTALHFLVTSLAMEVMACCGFFTRNRMPLKDSFLMAATGIGAVASQNFSLEFNSVGFYQVMKLLCIPCMVVIQTYFYAQHFSPKIKSTLFIILFGVAIATVTDMQMNMLGSVIGLAAVLFVTQTQIWQGAKQKQYELNPMQINHTQALPSFLIACLFAIVFETGLLGPASSNVFEHTFSFVEWFYLILSGFLALSVNLCSYGLIGKTSAVTYQVVGHFKTCLILLGGFYLFPIPNWITLCKNLFGICVAMFGVVVYGHITLNEKVVPHVPDWYDLWCAAGCINVFCPHVSNEERRINLQESVMEEEEEMESLVDQMEEGHVPSESPSTSAAPLVRIDYQSNNEPTVASITQEAQDILRGEHSNNDQHNNNNVNGNNQLTQDNRDNSTDTNQQHTH